MKFDLAKAGFCVILLLEEALATDGSRTYYITMEQPAPYYASMVATIPAGFSIQWNN
ncbi:MAG: hypothetical protein NPIRA01_25410 [Nitrospirales bacterium]|nr:MAG: hypothetical protein NPIRA01_25410 [Nitrospirales bacterium]